MKLMIHLQLVSSSRLWVTCRLYLFHSLFPTPCLADGTRACVCQYIDIHRSDIWTNETLVCQFPSKMSNFWVIFLPLWYGSCSCKLWLFLLVLSALILASLLKSRPTVNGFWQRSIVLARWSRSLLPVDTAQWSYYFTDEQQCTDTMSRTIIHRQSE